MNKSFIKQALPIVLYSLAGSADQIITYFNNSHMEALKKITMNSSSPVVPETTFYTVFIGGLFQHRIFVFIGLLILAIVVDFRKTKSENKSDKDALQAYLDKVHSRYFCVSPNSPDPNMRLTYFTPQFSIWHMGRRLRKFVRASTLHQESDVAIDMKKIKVKTSGGVNKIYFDGVVGESWAKGIMIKVENLPNYDTATDAKKRIYKRDSNLFHKTQDEFEKFSMKPRSIVAIPIPDKSSHKAGVFVIESMDIAIVGYQASCNKAVASRVFTEQVFTDIVDNIQCIFMR